MSRTKQYYRFVDTGNNAFLIGDDGKPLDMGLARSLLEKASRTIEAPMYLYIGKDVHGRYKIGITNNVERRSVELAIDILHSIPCQRMGRWSARSIESWFHEIFKFLGQHIEGEWFSLTNDDLSLFKLIQDGKPDAFGVWDNDISTKMDAMNRVREQMLNGLLEAVNKTDAQIFQRLASSIIYEMSPVSAWLAIRIANRISETIYKGRDKYSYDLMQNWISDIVLMINIA